MRTIEVSANLYNRIEKNVRETGKFEFVRGNYARSLKRACQRAGENWTGSHGLRWNYVQNRFRELQETGGKNYEEALQAVAIEIGHSRPEITLHYLR